MNAKLVVNFNLTTAKAKTLETVNTYIEGNVVIEVEKDKHLNFFAKIDATNDEWITIDGEMTGLYSDTLGV